MRRSRFTRWALRIAKTFAIVVTLVSYLVFVDIGQSSGSIAATGSAFVVFLVTLSLSIVFWRRLRRPGRRAELGQCPECGYDRRGLAADTKCPECGAASAT